MEPQFQTSFIPKKPIISGSRDSVGGESTTSLFTVFSTIIFIIAIVLCGGLFAYKQMLANQIVQANKDIVSSKEAFQTDTIKELIDVSSRISATQKLLDSHLSTSQLFGLLQTLTLKKVSFNNFVFEDKGNGILSISMAVEGQSYNALAEQMNVFTSTAYIRDPKFTDFDVSTNGNITTSLSATIDPSILSYQKFINP